MLHRTFGRKLNRDIKERKALYRSLVIALVKCDKIETTITRAKTISPLIDKLVTNAKKGTRAGFKKVTAFLIHKEESDRFLNVIVPHFTHKKGGYVRIRRVGRRHGDQAETVMMEWSVSIKEEKPVKKKKAEVSKVKGKTIEKKTAVKKKISVKNK